MKANRGLLVLLLVFVLASVAPGQVAITAGIAKGSTVQSNATTVCSLTGGGCVLGEGVSGVATVETTLQLAAVKTKLDSINSALNDTNSKLQTMADVLNSNKIMLDDFDKFKSQVLSAIDQRFQKLPSELAASDAIKQLKIDIKTEVEQDLKSPNH